MYYIEQSKSTETHKGYESHWNMYLKYCIHFHYIPLPFTYIRMLMYAAFRARFVSLKTVKKDITAIKHFNNKYGYPAMDTQGDDMFEKMVEGIKKCYGSQDRDPRIPIVWEHFDEIVKSFDLTSYDQLVVFLSLVVTSQACLRVGEVYPMTTNVHADRLDTPSFRTLWCRNFSIIWNANGKSIDYVVITLRATKNDKKKKPVPIPLGKGKWPLAPIDLFVLYMRKREQLSRTKPYLKWQPKAPLFQLSDGSVLTQQKALKHLRYATNKMGLPNDKVTLYGLRYGTATSLARRNVDPTIIKTMGRWHSDAYQVYIKMDPKMIVHLMQSYQKMPIVNGNVEFTHATEASFQHIPQ